MSQRVSIVVAAAVAFAASSLGIAWAAGGLESDGGKAALSERAAKLQRALLSEKRRLGIARESSSREPAMRGRRGPRGKRGPRGAAGPPGPRGLGGVTIARGPLVPMCDYSASCAVESSTATCPAGQVVLGGGWDTTSPGIDMTASLNAPLGNNAWLVIVVNYY